MNRKDRYSYRVSIGCVLFVVAVAACTMESGGDGGGGGGGGDDDVEDCGDKACTAGETPASCPADCKTPTDPCGNSVCDGGETPQSCPADCKVCGNNTCEAGETAQSCPADCDVPRCGDSVCEGNETTTCQSDCPATLRVQNNSSYTIANLYLAPCGGNWTSDQTGASSIAPGNLFTLTGIPAGCWWFRATTAGEAYYWQTPNAVTLVPAGVYTWTLAN